MPRAITITAIAAYVVGGLPVPSSSALSGQPYWVGKASIAVTRTDADRRYLDARP